MLAVHEEDDDTVVYSYQKLQHEGQIGIEYMHQAHNNLCENLSFQRAITLPPMSEPITQRTT
jgi:dihydropyrimidinase